MGGTRKKSKARRAPKEQAVDLHRPSEQEAAAQLREMGFQEITPEHLEADRLRLELGQLASRYSLAGRSDVSKILWAIQHTLSHDDKKAREWLKRKAGESEAYLDERNAGPRTRSHEIDYFEAVVRRALEDKMEPKEMAERLLRTLRATPLLSVDTDIPRGRWLGGAREELKRRIEFEVHRTESFKERAPRKVARAVLRSVGMSSRKANDVFSGQMKRKTRERP